MYKDHVQEVMEKRFPERINAAAGADGSTPCDLASVHERKEVQEGGPRGRAGGWGDGSTAAVYRARVASGFCE